LKLKEYQEGVLSKLDRYLAVLGEKRDEAEAFAEFQKERGRQASLTDYPREAWEQLNLERRLPLLKEKEGEVPAPHLSRTDGMHRSVPNICLKVPTGGGKTLLASAAIGPIQADYFRRQTGLVLWIVPSDAIYRQTWKQLADREHPYRQMLERASGGRVKLLEKTDAFSVRDAEGMLCILLLMLPSAARQSKETLRMFRDSGKFASFFPPEDDDPANENLLRTVPNLDYNDLADLGYGQGILPGSISLKQSLGNVLRLLRPLIVLDEGHRAYTDTARKTLLDFNPRFILELSATPNTNHKHQSNVLVNVPGVDLKDEQMIKLPINVINEAKGGWKHTLMLAHAKLAELAKEANALRAADGRYIRPILVVRVERTGKGQEEKQAVHAEHAKKYLTETLGVREEEIRLKTSDLDELGDEDLLLEACPVRYIITKDALREGWDCPFAYVLAILSKTTAQTALTQMIGRILRQPHARLTGRMPLDECYVYTFDQDVNEAVQGVRRGLADEGMEDLASTVRGIDAASGQGRNTRKETIRHRERFRKLPFIFLPRVLHRDASSTPKGWRLLDYDRDILAELDWENFNYSHPDADLSEEDHIRRTVARVNINRESQQHLPLDLHHETVEWMPGEGLDLPFLARQLLDVIPNPWQAMRILEDCLNILRENGVNEERLYVNRLELIHTIKLHMSTQVTKAAENLFREKLNRGEIAFKLASLNNPSLNWQLSQTLETQASDADRPLNRKNGAPLEKAIFETLYARDFNSLERDAAWHLDESEAVYWWHRIAAGGKSYGLQGWQRNKVYPDLIACVRDRSNAKLRFSLLETKGDHLKGNNDTVYKGKLFDLLTLSFDSRGAAGELQLELDSQPVRFRMLMEEDWRASLQIDGL
jgi:type III restriction enzyme